ncbi:MAG: hypothetical protein PQJ58_15415 [Spirochaetales bacterium]|nr:hypothetical protein [Spirochaetales bacterium]
MADSLMITCRFCGNVFRVFMDEVDHNYTVVCPDCRKKMKLD